MIPKIPRPNFDLLRAHGDVVDRAHLPRIDCDQLRREGMKISAKVHEKREPRGINMPNVTLAVAAYEALEPKPWGCLTRIAEEFKTTPGSILNRIKRRDKISGLIKK